MTFRFFQLMLKMVKWGHTGFTRPHKLTLMTLMNTRSSKLCVGFHAVFVTSWRWKAERIPKEEASSRMLSS